MKDEQKFHIPIEDFLLVIKNSLSVSVQNVLNKESLRSHQSSLGFMVT